MENYKLLARAGEGAHGQVYKGMCLTSNALVALKQIRVNISCGIPKNTMREICALRALQSKYIVKLIDVFGVDGTVVLVMEFLPHNLAELLRNKELPLLLPQVKNYMKMMLSGLKTMHSQCIMHRDLKPANLLISDSGILKIADFGLSRIYNERKRRQYSHQVATRWYRAPELLYGSKNYTPAVDMWAVGCILGEMITRQPLFAGESDIEQLAIVLATMGTPNEDNWPGLTDLPDYNKIAFTPSLGRSWDTIIPQADEATLDLIKNILLYDYKKRLTANQTLKHRFFKEHPPPCSLSEMTNFELCKYDVEFPEFDSSQDAHK